MENTNERRTEAVNLRVEPWLKAMLIEAAERERRSVSNYVINALMDKLEHDRIAGVR